MNQFALALTNHTPDSACDAVSNVRCNMNNNSFERRCNPGRVLRFAREQLRRGTLVFAACDDVCGL